MVFQSVEFLHHRQVLAKWFQPNQEWIDFPQEATEQSVISRFEQIVQRYPDRIALKVEEQLFTYAEMEMALLITQQHAAQMDQDKLEQFLIELEDAKHEDSPFHQESAR